MDWESVVSGRWPWGAVTIAHASNTEDPGSSFDMEYFSLRVSGIASVYATLEGRILRR